MSIRAMNRGPGTGDGRCPQCRCAENPRREARWVARNKALTVLRRRSTEELDEEQAAAIEDPGPNPEAIMENRQKTEIVRNCLTQLSPTHREVIDLVYYHEKSIDEVAEITAVPPNTVKTRMFYARKRIAELMTAQGISTATL